MTELTTRIYNVETGNITEVPFGAVELAQNAADLETQRSEKEAAQAKAEAKAALLERLGITADEAALLLS